jgi:hypothetical protein
LSVAKSGLVVADVDCKPGKNGLTTYERYDWPRTLRVRTTTGGIHLYYNQTNAVRFVTGKQNIFGPDTHIDAPGYVLIPGSVLDTGRYTILDDAPVANAPDWLAPFLEHTAPDAADQEPVIDLDQPGNIAWAVEYLKRDAPPAIEGRNGEFTLLVVAGHLKDHGLGEHTAVELLLDHYNQRCQPPWDAFDGQIADRLDVKVANAYRYLKQVQPGAATAEADFGGDVEEFTYTGMVKPVVHPSRRKARADKYVRDHYTVVNGTLYPKHKARRARR